MCSPPLDSVSSDAGLEGLLFSGAKFSCGAFLGVDWGGCEGGRVWCVVVGVCLGAVTSCVGFASLRCLVCIVEECLVTRGE